MNIVIGSAFRNSAHNAATYMDRVAALLEHLSSSEGAHTLRLSAVYGDCVDNTAEALTHAARDRGIRLTLTNCSHGGPVYGSTEQPERMAALSKVGNAIFDSVTQQDDVLFYVESDLIWSPETAMHLCRMAHYAITYAVFAPKVTAYEAFYDIWGFRHLDGSRFSPFETIPLTTEVSSVGSCFAVNVYTARTCRIRDDNALVGWCRDVTDNGRRIVVLGDMEVHHI